MGGGHVNDAGSEVVVVVVVSNVSCCCCVVELIKGVGQYARP